MTLDSLLPGPSSLEQPENLMYFRSCISHAEHIKYRQAEARITNTRDD